MYPSTEMTPENDPRARERIGSRTTLAHVPVTNERVSRNPFFFILNEYVFHTPIKRDRNGVRTMVDRRYLLKTDNNKPTDGDSSGERRVCDVHHVEALLKWELVNMNGALFLN